MPLNISELKTHLISKGYKNVDDIFEPGDKDQEVKDLTFFLNNIPNFSNEKIIRLSSLDRILYYSLGNINVNYDYNNNENVMKKLIADIFLYILPSTQYFEKNNKYKISLSFEDQQIIGCYSQVSTGIITNKCHKIGIDGLVDFKGIMHTMHDMIKTKFIYHDYFPFTLSVELFKWIYEKKLLLIELYYKKLYNLIINCPPIEKKCYIFRVMKTDNLLDMETFV